MTRDWLGVGLATGAADRVTAESGVRTAYEQAGLRPPATVVWCGSPHAGALAAGELAAIGESGRSVRAQVRTRPWAAARAEATARLGHLEWARHWAATGQRNWRLVVDRVVAPLRARLEDDLAERRLILLDAVLGQHDAAWLGAHDGSAALSGLAQISRSAGWWWPFEEAVVLTERPVELHRDNLGRLHHGEGAALSYPDGWAMFAWRGMPIPPELAAELPHVTAQRIRKEENAEIRRVMLEHFGFDRYLRESKAKRLHEDECGVLWRVELPGDEPLVMVEVVNSTPEPDGSRRTYFLRVPPETVRAREGVAWTFGVTEEEYRPLAQA